MCLSLVCACVLISHSLPHITKWPLLWQAIVAGKLPSLEMAEWIKDKWLRTDYLAQRRWRSVSSNQCVPALLHTRHISIHIFWLGGKWRTACFLSYSRIAVVWLGEYSYCIIYLWYDSCTDPAMLLYRARRLNSEMCEKLEISWIRPTWMSGISTGAHLRVLWFSVWTEAVRNLVCGNTYQRLICSTEILWRQNRELKKYKLFPTAPTVFFFCLLFTWKYLFFLWSWLILKKKNKLQYHCVFLLFCKLKYLQHLLYICIKGLKVLQI